MKRIEILLKAHKLLKKQQGGICVALYKVIIHNIIMNSFNLPPKNIHDYFPLLTLENAKKFGAEDLQFWWDPREYGLFSGRRRFMRWLMWKYRNDKGEL